MSLPEALTLAAIAFFLGAVFGNVTSKKDNKFDRCFRSLNN